jgi:nitrogen regulatory protein P-II 1
MKFRKVTAIISRDALERVEQALQARDVHGVSVTRSKGFGEYANFFQHEWMSSHLCVEVFAARERAEGVARAIMDAAYTGLPGDGIVAIVPVEELFVIRTRGPADVERF